MKEEELSTLQEYGRAIIDQRYNEIIEEQTSNGVFTPEDSDGELQPLRTSYLDEEGSVLGAAVDMAQGAKKIAGDVAVQAFAGVDDTVRNTLNIIPGLEWSARKLDELVGIDSSDGIAGAKTLPGAITREITKFASGYVPAFKVLKKLNLVAKTQAGKRLQDMAVGAGVEFAVRAPDEEKFADLLYRLGVPKNAVLDYLKADPEDNWFEGRLKNAIDGVVGGVVGEALVEFGRVSKRVSKLIKDHKGPKKGEADVAPQLTEAQRRQKEDYQTGEAIVKAIGRFGTPTNKLVETVKSGVITDPKVLPGAMKKEARTVANRKAQVSKQAVGDPELQRLLNKPMILGDQQIYVNYANIDKPEDVLTVLKNVTELTAPLIERKQMRMTHKQQVAAAEKMGLDHKDLLNRPDGSVWTEREVIAYTTLWKNAMENLEEAVRVANKPDASKMDLLTLHKMTASFGAINAEVRGASAASSRSLRAWGINAPGLAAQARRMDEMLLEIGGEGTSTAIARKMMAMVENGTLGTRAGNKVIRKYAEGDWVDGLREAFVGGLLWMPSTHIVNAASALSVAALEVGKRKMAAIMGDGVAEQEASLMMGAALHSIGDAFQYAARAWKTGQTGRWGTKVDMGPKAQWTANAFGLKDDSFFGNLMNWAGVTFRAPLRFLGATDEFSKTIAYRMEVMAQAGRAAAAKGLKEGPEYQKFLHDFVSAPPDSVKKAGEDFAKQTTFTNDPGSLAKFMNKLRNNPTHNGALRFGATMVFPFVNTPTNILKYSFANSPFAVLSSNFRKRFMSDNPAERAMARAQLSAGTAIMAVAADWADSGILTGNGPTDPNERKRWLEDHQPYSIRIGNKWYSLSRADPIGIMMSFMGNMGYIGKQYEMGATTFDEFSEIAGGLILSAGEVVINKNYMQGFANLIEVVREPKRNMETWVGKSLAAFMPFSSAMGLAARTLDDNQVRESNRIWDHVKQRMPGSRKDLVPVRNYWGEKVDRRSGEGIGSAFFDFFTPLSGQEATDNPINKELSWLNSHQDKFGATIPGPITMESSFMDTAVEWEQWPNEYDRWREILSNTEITPDGTLKQTLNAMVRGDGLLSFGYEMQPSVHMKIEYIAGIVGLARDKAEAEMMQELSAKGSPFLDYLANVQENQLLGEVGAGGEGRGVIAPGLE
jgi:hypothetical protein